MEKRDPNRRVVFKELGNGVYLLLRNSGLRQLYNEYGTDHVQIVERAFLTLDFEVMEKLLTLMIWKGEEQVEMSIDEMDHFSLELLVNNLRDAWSLSLNGRKYLEQVDFISKEIAKSQGDGADDQSPLSMSPEESSGRPSAEPTG